VPPLLRILALVGVLIGSTSALFSISVARELLGDREELVQKVRQQMAEQSGASPSPAASPSPEASPSPAANPPGGISPDEAVGMVWDVRGVVLPLLGIWLILSFLLFSGCLRALRGSAWGASAWKMACAAWLGFQAILFVLLLIRLHEAMPPMVLLVGSLYPVGVLAYLRRPHIAALFR
jgi:hypothetical protein